MGDDDADERPVSPFFPVLTQSRREQIAHQQRLNENRKAAERLAAEVMALLAEESRRQRYIRDTR